MKAVVCREYGPPETLQIDEIADPTPQPGQAVVRVRAASVNFPDVLMLSGAYQVRLPPPFTPGSEFAGEVLDAGDSGYRRGDRVSGSAMVGAFAEQIAVDLPHSVFRAAHDRRGGTG